MEPCCFTQGLGVLMHLGCIISLNASFGLYQKMNTHNSLAKLAATLPASLFFFLFPSTLTVAAHQWDQGRDALRYYQHLKLSKGTEALV